MSSSIKMTKLKNAWVVAKKKGLSTLTKECINHEPIKVRIKRTAYGSVQEAYRQSWTYFITYMHARLIHKLASDFACDVEAQINGYEFCLQGSKGWDEKDVIAHCKKANIEVEFYK